MESMHQLSDLQLAIMRVLWSRAEATVAQVHAGLQDERNLAVTTIATVLSRLEKRGLVSHRRDGRQFVYRPLVSDREVQLSMLEELTDRVYQGDVTSLVSHLLHSRDVSTGDLARVKALIEKKERDADATDATAPARSRTAGNRSSASLPDTPQETSDADD